MRQRKTRIKKISVIGLGYVGLPLAVEFAKKNIRVVGVDRNKERVKMVNSGISYIDDISNEDLKSVSQRTLFATTEFGDVEDSEAVFICVPTPLTKNKTPDTSYIVKVVNELIPYISNGMLLVLESTSYPGTTEEIILPILRNKGLEVGKDFYLAFSPERIDPGNKRFPISKIPKVVGGIDEESTEFASEIYRIITPKIFKISSARAAEMTKLLENTFRLVNIALINEIAMLCEKLEINIWEVIEAAKTKPYGFMPFYPGPGIGGHCIPVDPFYLLWKAKELDVDISFIELAEKIIDSMPDYIVNKISYALNSQRKSIKGSKILVIGVAYKKDIGDVRESPAIKVISKLIYWGAKILYYDPFVPEIKIGGDLFKSISLLSKDILNESDCVVILTDHSSINYDLILENSNIIVDTRGAIKKHKDNIFKLGDGSG